MPTKRFYKLSEKKKTIIRDAVFREFIRVPMEKVSITRIIQDAGISRGSYYTYFEDREDMLLYLVEETAGQLYLYAERCLSESDGNLWRMGELLLDRMLEQSDEMGQGRFVRNALREPNIERLRKEFWLSYNGKGGFSRSGALEENIYQQCVGRSVISMDRESFSAFLQILMVLLESALRRYTEGEPLESVTRDFRIQMRILRRGVGCREVSRQEERKEAKASTET